MAKVGIAVALTEKATRLLDEPACDRLSREVGADGVVLLGRGRDGRWHGVAVPRTSRPRNARRAARRAAA